MDELTSRQKEILIRTIESYIETILPVGSRTLTERYPFCLSPASVRHELGVLEEQGYLSHPHTSAGRIPTDKGYRLYAEEAVSEEPVSEAFLELISREMEGRAKNLDTLLERASRVLSTMAEEAVLMVLPTLRPLHLKELNLLLLDENRVLAVWCSTSGLIQDCLIVMEEPVSPEELDRIRNFINEELAGTAIEALETELLKKIEARRDSLRRLYEKTLRIVRESLPYWEVPRVFVEGSRYVLNQPEFQDVEKFRNLVAALEEKPALIRLVSREPRSEGKVHIAIGAKELSRDIWDCSLISSSYQWRGRWAGAFGILGPRRMPYGRMIGLVRQMAGQISQTLERWGS